MNFKKIAIVLLFVCTCFFTACGTDDGVTVIDINGDIVISADGSITCDGAVISGSKNTNLKSSAEYVIKQDGSIIVRVDGKEYLIQKDVDVVIPAKDADIPQITTSSNNIYSIPLDGIKVGDTTITHDCAIVSGDNKISTDDKGNMVISTANGDYIINKKNVQPLSSNDDAVSVTLPDGQTVGVGDIMDIISGISINPDGSITIDGSIISNSDDGITLSTDYGDYAANVNNVTISAEEVKNLIYQITGEDGNVLDLVALADDINIDNNGNIVTPNGTITIQEGKVTVVAPKKSTAYTLPNGIIVDRGAIEYLDDGSVVLPEVINTYFPAGEEPVVVFDNEIKLMPNNLCYDYSYWACEPYDSLGNWSWWQVSKDSPEAVWVKTIIYDYNYIDEWLTPRMISSETVWLEDSRIRERIDYEYDSHGNSTKVTTVRYDINTNERSKMVSTHSSDNPLYFTLFDYDAEDNLIERVEILNFDDPEISFPQVYKRFNPSGVLIHYSEMDKSGTEIAVYQYTDEGELLHYMTPNFIKSYNEDGSRYEQYWYADGTAYEITFFPNGNTIESGRDTLGRYTYYNIYDNNGNLLSAQTHKYDVDGYAKITTHIRTNYDEINAYRQIICENSSGVTVFHQTFNVDGTQISEAKYTDEGNTIYYKNFDEFGNLKHSETFEYNVDGWYCISTSISYAYGYTSKYYYDENNIPRKEMRYFENGQLWYITEYNENGETAYSDYYTEDGTHESHTEYLRNVDGWQMIEKRWIYTYDPPLSIYYYNNDTLCVHEIYDADNNLIERIVINE